MNEGIKISFRMIVINGEPLLNLTWRIFILMPRPACIKALRDKVELGGYILSIILNEGAIIRPIAYFVSLRM